MYQFTIAYMISIYPHRIFIEESIMELSLISPKYRANSTAGLDLSLSQS